MGTTVPIVSEPGQIEDLLTLEKAELVVRDIHNIAFNFQNSAGGPLVAQLYPRLQIFQFRRDTLRFRIAPYEMTIFADGRAILKGTQDPAVARSLYARYIGT